MHFSITNYCFMGLNPKPICIVCVVAILITAKFFQCSNVADTKYNAYEDTTASVYGPYRIIKLPITKGVNILNPIQVALGPDNKIFAANETGEVYILQDSDGDNIEDEAVLFCNISELGLKSPTGFTHRGDTIYIGTAQEVRIYLDRNKDGKADTSWTFFNDIPYSEHPYEWTTGLSFGPDGWLYCAFTTDSWNAGPSPDPKKYRGSIIRISPDGKSSEAVATGIRSVYGMAFNQLGDLFFADNEGGGNTKEELNHLVRGAFYGHNPKKYESPDSSHPPVHALQTEMAPGGIAFNPASNDFGGTGGDLFIAFYGPGERWNRGGVGRIKMQKQGYGYQFEEYPVADIPKLSALVFGKDGSLYVAHHGVSDYWYKPIEKKTGGFYKIIYDPSLKNKPMAKRAINTTDLSANSVEVGKDLYGTRACAACHATDESEELIGPNLNGIGARMSREEILEEIEFPSRRIKPSMIAMRITKTDGKVLLGRVVNADENKISLMLIGNHIVDIPRAEISKSEEEKKSLMYEKLLSGLSKEEVASLVDYLVSLR